MINEKQQLAELQVLKLTDELDRIFQGYSMRVITCVLISCLKRAFDSEPDAFYFYMNLAVLNKWFEPKKKLGTCKISECQNLIEANDLCKEHLADGAEKQKPLIVLSDNKKGIK